MKKQIGKSQIFTKESLTNIQDKMRNYCINSYNKVYDKESKLKQKQKGRNKDINVNEMFNYGDLKKEREENSRKLNEANQKADNLEGEAKDVDNILNSLKSTGLNRNNKVISNEDVNKIKKLTKQINDTTKSIKGVNQLNNVIEKFDNEYESLIKENNILKRQNTFQSDEIKNLNEKLSMKDKLINKLTEEKEKLQTQLYKFKGFWKNIITKFKYKVFDERTGETDNMSYSEVEKDLYNSNIINDEEKKMIDEITRKVKYTEENINDKTKKKNDFNLN